jgi:hypothetical protein
MIKSHVKNLSKNFKNKKKMNFHEQFIIISISILISDTQKKRNI